MAQAPSAPAAPPSAGATHSPTASPEPELAPALRKQVEQAKGVAAHLLKGIKQIGMYRHAESKYGEFLQKTHDALGAYLSEHGPLQLKVDMTNLQLHKQDLFSEDNPLSYKFFKDGIRTLIFRPDVGLDELVKFTVIALSDPDRGSEDINVQLWNAQLPHIEYIMVEGFRMDEFSEEEIQVDVEKVVDYLQRRLRADSEDYLRYARVNAEDLDMKLEGVDQMRGLVVTGITASPEYKLAIQKEIHDDENQRLFPKLISAVFQVVESGVDDAQLLEDMFVQLLDAMLLQEDFATIGQLVLKLRAMVQRQGDASPMGRLLKAFVGKMAEEQRLSRIGDILKSSRVKNPNDLVRYFNELTPSTAPILINVLESIEAPENRQLLVDALVAFAKEAPDPFVEALKSERPQTVRDMVQILDRSKHPSRLKFFGEVLKSKNPAMKVEVIGIIGKGRSPEARLMISSCLEDPSKPVRIAAIKALPELDRDKSFADLLRQIKEPSFAKRDDDEKEALYVALGSTGLPAAMTYFQELLSVKGGLFTKGKVLDDKLHAVSGLIGACTIATYKLLTELADDKGQPAEVQSAAKLGMLKVKKILFAGAEVPGQTHG